jgi:hypothetical protein
MAHMLYLMAGMLLYLLCTGGVGNTGPLWLYFFPTLTFFAQGLRAWWADAGHLHGVMCLYRPDSGFTFRHRHLPDGFQTAPAGVHDGGDHFGRDL